MASRTVYGLAMVKHLKNVGTTFAQMSKRITNIEFATDCPTIAKTILGAVFFSFLNIQQFVQLSCLLILR